MRSKTFNLNVSITKFSFVHSFVVKQILSGKTREVVVENIHSKLMSVSEEVRNNQVKMELFQITKVRDDLCVHLLVWVLRCIRDFLMFQIIGKHANLRLPYFSNWLKTLKITQTKKRSLMYKLHFASTQKAAENCGLVTPFRMSFAM